VRAHSPSEVQIVSTAENIGFSPAVNLGMEVALRGGANWVLLLNNDAVVDAKCLERCLVEAQTHPRVAAVGPAIVFADRPQQLWFGGGEVSQWFAFTRHRGLLRAASTPPPSGKTDFVTGCCMLLSKAAWTAIGPFRTDFFAYYEDAEWCQRAAARGWQCRYVGEVLCTHAVGVTSARRNSLGLSETTAYYLARNPLRFALETTNPVRRFTRVVGLTIVWNAYNAWRLLLAGRPNIAAAYAIGILDAWRGRMGPRSLVRAAQ